jgi:hypothetical protein
VTLEQILVVALLVLVPLLNALVRVLRRRLAGPPPPESGPRASETPGHVRRVSSSLGGQRGEAGGLPPSVPPPPLAGVLQPRRRPKLRIGSARAARRAIVLMAVFGPCRGLEPLRLPRRGQPNA